MGGASEYKTRFISLLEDAVTKPIHLLGLRDPREFFYYDHQ